MTLNTKSIKWNNGCLNNVLTVFYIRTRCFLQKHYLKILFSCFGFTATFKMNAFKNVFLRGKPFFIKAFKKQIYLSCFAFYEFSLKTKTKSSVPYLLFIAFFPANIQTNKWNILKVVAYSKLYRLYMRRLGSLCEQMHFCILHPKWNSRKKSFIWKTEQMCW